MYDEVEVGLVAGLEGEWEWAFDEWVEEEVDDYEDEHTCEFDGDALRRWSWLHFK